LLILNSSYSGFYSFAYVVSLGKAKNQDYSHQVIIRANILSKSDLYHKYLQFRDATISHL